MLEDFSGNKTTTLEDLSSEQGSVVVANRASNINLAAHTSLLSGDPEQLVENFRDISAELEVGGSSQSAEVIMAEAAQRSDLVTRQVVVDTLIDPSLSDDERRNIIKAYEDQTRDFFSTREAVATEALVAPSAFESVEAETVRISAAGVIKPTLDAGRQRQALLNMEIAKSNNEVVSIVGDIMGLLFPLNEQLRTADVHRRLLAGEGDAYEEAAFFMGERKQEIIDILKAMPPEQQMEFTQRIIDVVNKNSSIALVDDNDFSRILFLKTFLEDGYYTDLDRWVDNVITVLDLVALGGYVKSAFITSKIIQNAKREMIRGRVQPVSPSQTIKDVNPARAKAIHEVAASDETGEAAQALYGTSKDDAVANDILPEVGTVDGSVRAKVAKPESINDAEITPNGNILDFSRGQEVGINYFEEEKRSMRARVVNDFHNAKGMQARTEMTQVYPTSSGIDISMYYGPSQGGFSNPKQALAMAKMAFRDYGIDDSALVLMRRVNDEYVPTNLKELQALETVEAIVAKKGKQRGTGKRGKKYINIKVQPDFLVKVDHSYKFNPADVVKWAETDVKYNWFDRIPMLGGKTHGSFTRHLFDPASLLSPTLSQGANFAVDTAAALEKRLLELGTEFSDKFVKLKPNRRQLLERYIKESNSKGTPFNINRLHADGYTPEEVSILKSWKESWDTIYWIENDDLVKTLKSRNYHKFVDPETDTILFAKPLARTQVSGKVSVYNQVDDTIEFMDATQLKALYEAGGTIAQLRRPLQVGDEAAELIVAGEGQLKKLQVGDQALNYRHGYYSVQYKDPIFLDEVFKDKNGVELYRKAIWTAETKEEAMLIADRLRATGKDIAEPRLDARRLDRGSDTAWDLEVARGRSAQRVRGERLEDATNHITDLPSENILDPVDSLIHSARSVSRRTSMSEYLDTAKVRFISQYEDLLPEVVVNGRKIGVRRWPNSLDELGQSAGDVNSSRLADARTTFEYLNYLENGYANTIDDVYKSVMRGLASIAGNAQFGKAEKALHWLGDAKAPTSAAKGTAFNLYLALNPGRQFIVQSHQSVQLTALFPAYVVTGKLAREWSVLTSVALGQKPSRLALKAAGMTEDDALKMWKQFEDSGLAASIDKQNLVRGSMNEVASMNQYAGRKGSVDRALAPFTKALDFSRVIGFDAGENINIMTAWLAYRNQALKAGKTLDAGVLAEVSAKARNVTYNMTQAGDMPYNQNALNTIMQFMQVPHKALLGMTTNRVLTVQEKLRLFGFNAVMYTLPPVFMYEFFGAILPEDPDMRDNVVQGLEGALINAFLTAATGEKTAIDFTSLAPSDTFGSLEFITSLLSADIGTILASTPSGQLLFGNNPRITKAAKAAARYGNLIDDYEDPTTFGNVAHQFASMASGYSNAYKARYMLAYGQKLNSVGGISDPNVTTIEAIATALGMGTIDEAKGYVVSAKSYNESKLLKEDFNKWYIDLKRHVTREGMTTQELEYVSRMTSEFFRVTGNDNPLIKQMFLDNLRKDVQGRDMKLFRVIKRAMQLPDDEEARKIINAIPQDDNLRKQQLEALDFMKNYKEPE